jgi:hypothetical protein
MTMFKRHPELVSGSIYQPQPVVCEARWTLKQVQGDGCVRGLA